MKKDLTKKYELLEKEKNGLCRIRALKDFGDVEKGEIGGYVKGYDNLSQEGNCWIYDDAMVFGKAKVSDNAIVCDNAVVYEEAKIFGEAEVSDNAEICGKAMIYKSADISGNVKVYDNAKVADALVKENAKIFGNSFIDAKARIYGYAYVKGNSKVLNSCEISGKAYVCQNAVIKSDVIIGVVTEEYDNIVFVQISSGLVTIYSKDNKVYFNINGDFGKFFEDFAGMTLEGLQERLDKGNLVKYKCPEEFIRIMKSSKTLLGIE